MAASERDFYRILGRAEERQEGGDLMPGVLSSGPAGALALRRYSARATATTAGRAQAGRQRPPG